MNRLCILATFLMLCIPGLGSADELKDNVDKLFARWDKKTTPGCAIGVIRDGKLIYERAYGMADLEQGSPIGPNTVFHIASISKQFTAFAILLLEKDGKLSLDDDIRKYLPEMHDFGKTITIRHLLNHTSGLRDQWSLLTLAGWRMDDVITDDDIFRLACRQRDLNFPPGDRHLYSNMGYTLAAMIVERVSGQAFRAFTRKQIFEPLGMTQTRFPTDHEEIIPGRARSYNPTGPGKYKNAVLTFSTAGATSLLTTVGDLAKWDNNFYEPRVGNAKLIARFQEVGILNNKKTISYALGLDIGDHRGLKTVEHSGSDAGYRCTLLRFPTERFSVIVLANSGDSGPSDLARRVADLYLKDKLKPLPTQPPATEKKEVKIDPALFDAYAGEYQLMPDRTVTVTKEKDRLTSFVTGFPKRDLVPASDREFFVRGENFGITFDKPVEGRSPALTLQVGDRGMPAPRVKRVVLTEKQAEEYVGEYHSRELGVIYSITRKDNKLKIHHPRGDVELRPTSENVFFARYPLGTITFTRNKDGQINGFKIDENRVLNVRFERVQIKPTT
jgi:CubicO group peptidase (beta-lactamase class C family)